MELGLSDPVFLLGALFPGGPLPTCRDAANGNDDEHRDITDAVHLLVRLFQDGSPPECQFHGGC